jgi:hypothetical protein
MNRVKKMANSKLTLTAIHEKRIKEIKDHYKTRPQKEALLNECQRKFRASRGLYTADVYELSKQIENLKREIEDIDSQRELTEYYINSDRHVQEYKNAGVELDDDAFGGDEDAADKKPTAGKGSIFTHYVEECLGGIYRKDPEFHLMCDDCDIPRIINHKEAQAICTECGSIIPYQDSDNFNEFSEEIEVLTTFAYKPINHFREWISKLLARDSANISDEMMEKIWLELKKDRITKIEDIDDVLIRSYLKKLGLNKFYEDIPAILFKICGKKPKNISKELELKMISMFEQILEPYKRHKPPNRINFLSYSYVISKFLQILGEHELAANLTRLKSREKLLVQDSIFRAITLEVSWPFIPSV